MKKIRIKMVGYIFCVLPFLLAVSAAVFILFLPILMLCRSFRRMGKNQR